MMNNYECFYRSIRAFTDDFEDFNFNWLKGHINDNYDIADNINFFDFVKYKNRFENIVRYFIFIYDSNDRNNGDGRIMNVSIYYDTKNDNFVFFCYEDGDDDAIIYFCRTGGVIYNLFNNICYHCNLFYVDVEILKDQD